jgi:hypothetical protein
VHEDAPLAVVFGLGPKRVNAVAGVRLERALEVHRLLTFRNLRPGRELVSVERRLAILMPSIWTGRPDLDVDPDPDARSRSMLLEVL